MMWSLVATLASLALIGGLGLGLYGLLKSRFSQVYGEALALAEGDVLLESRFANNFGLESWGPLQNRGNGCLILSERTLVFVQISPRRSFRIPVVDLLGMEQVQSHLGKSTGRGLLKIRFLWEGKPDSLAFSLSGQEPWHRELQRLIEARRQPASRPLDRGERQPEG